MKLDYTQHAYYGDKKVRLNFPEKIAENRYVVYRSTGRSVNGKLIAREMKFSLVQNKNAHRCHLKTNPDKVGFWACHADEILLEISELKKAEAAEAARQKRLEEEKQNRERAEAEARKLAEAKNKETE